MKYEKNNNNNSSNNNNNFTAEAPTNLQILPCLNSSVHFLLQHISITILVFVLVAKNIHLFSGQCCFYVHDEYVAFIG